LRRIKTQPDNGARAAPVGHAACPVQVPAVDIQLGRHAQETRQVQQADGIGGLLRVCEKVGPDPEGDPVQQRGQLLPQIRRRGAHPEFGKPESAHPIGHDRDHAQIVDVVYAHPRLEFKADGHVAADVGRSRQRGVRQGRQRVLGGEYLERLRVKHGCAEAYSERRGRAACLPFLHAD